MYKTFPLLLLTDEHRLYCLHVFSWREVTEKSENKMKISEINSMANSSYLVVLFCASAGKNGEELGIDEEQIVLFVYLLYDLPNNKVC